MKLKEYKRQYLLFINQNLQRVIRQKPKESPNTASDHSLSYLYAYFEHNQLKTAHYIRVSESVLNDLTIAIEPTDLDLYQRAQSQHMINQLLSALAPNQLSSKIRMSNNTFNDLLEWS